MLLSKFMLKSTRNYKIAMSIIAAVVVALIVAIGYQWWTISSIKSTQDGNTDSAQQIQKVVDEASKIAVLPSETPTLATVSDQTKLADQEFFSDARDGDKVLMYTTARKAIIYRESENKIVNMGPIAITSEETDTDTTTN